MINYDFKNFFKEKISQQNDEFVTNGYFMISKSVLKKSQLKYVNENLPTRGEIDNLVNGAFKQQINKEIIVDFIPISVGEIIYNEEKNERYEVIFNSFRYNDNEINVFIQKKYYDFLIDLNCTLKITGVNSYDFVSIYHESKLAGVIAPVKAIKKEENKKYIKARCVFGEGIKDKRVKLISTIDGMEFYACKGKEEFSDYVFVDIVGYLYPIAKISQMELVPKKIKDDNINLLDFVKNYFERMLKNNHLVSFGVAEMLDRLEEAKLHNKKVHEINESRRQVCKEERDVIKKEQEEKERTFMEERMQELNKIIDSFEKQILNKEKTLNREVEIYNSLYDSRKTSLVLYVMKLYEIKIPIKTQGWINSALHSIYYDNQDEGYCYNYYKTSNNSNSFGKYLSELVFKIHEKYSQSKE
jgi:hypothetical protein